MADKRKKSVYLPGEIVTQAEAEAERQGRSLSYLLQLAWRIALPTIEKLPHANGEGVQ